MSRVSSVIFLLAVSMSFIFMAEVQHVSAQQIQTHNQVTGLAAEVGDRQFKLTWDIPTDDDGSEITSYMIREIVYGDDSTYTGDTIVTHMIPGDITYFNAKNRTSGVEYTLDVTAVTSEGSGHMSRQITVIPAAAPNSPSNVQAIPGDQMVTLKWDAPSTNSGHVVSGYSVASRLGTVNSFSTIDTVSAATTSLDISGLTNGLTYQFIIYADVNEGNMIAQYPSIVLDATPSTIKTPGEPTNLVSTAGDRNVTLTWEAPQDDGGDPITEYVIESRFIQVNFHQVEVRLLRANTYVVPGDVTTVKIDDIPNGTESLFKYEFTVTAKNAAGEGLQSEKTVVVPKGCTWFAGVCYNW